MKTIARFKEIASQPRFKGWPLVGDVRLGEKIPFFGQPMHYQLETGNGIEDYCSIIRHFGWSVVFGVTADSQVITLVQWKPGVNRASWELPPGGIGKVAPDIDPAELLRKTQESYLKETGFGGSSWLYLGSADVESGKYRGAGPDDHGLPAHMFLATGLEQLLEGRNPNANKVMETLMVPLGEFGEVIDSGLFREVSALPCALLALRRLGAS